jgi:zinc protease
MASGAARFRFGGGRPSGRLPSLVRFVSFVCAALSVGPVVMGCRVPKGAGAGSLVAAGVTAPVGGRQTRATFTLGNGLRVVLEENHVTPVVALQAWVGMGAADEPPEAAGAAHFTERLLTDSAKSAETAGGTFTSWTSFDETVFQMLVPAPFVDAGLDTLGRALTNPAAFDAAEIERVRNGIIQELRLGMDDAGTIVTRSLFREAFGAHPYGRPVVGSEATIRSVGRDQLAAFHRRAYCGANVTLVVVGDFDARAVRARVASAFAGLPGVARLPLPRPVAPVPDTPRATVVAGDVRDARLSLGFRIPALADEDLPAVDLLAAVLARGDGARLTGFGPPARLSGELVHNRQLASDVRASVWSSRDGGLVSLEVTGVTGRIEEVARVMLVEAVRLARQEILADELEPARAALEADVVRGKETSAGYARKLGLFATVADDPDYEDHYLQRLRALTAPDLRATAVKYLRTDHVAVAVLLPRGSASSTGSASGPGSASGAGALAGRLQELAAATAPPAIRATAAAQSGAVTTFDDVIRVVLPSGLRVLVLRDSTVPTVSVRALWAGGLRFEDARTNGISSLLAALLSRGTRTRDPERFQNDVTAIGGAVSGVAGRDELGLRAEFLARHWERGLELLADCLRNPRFADAEIERARRLLLERLRDEEDDARQIALGAFEGALWAKHPYRLNPSGTVESVSAVTRRRLVDHYRRHYGVPDLTIAVVGDVDVDPLVAKLAVLFGDARASAAPVAASTSAPADAVRETPVEVFRVLDGTTTRIVIGYPGLPLRDPERGALELLAEILTGPNGRLAPQLRDKLQLTSPVETFAWSGADGGAFAVTLASTAGRLDATVLELRAALGRVAAAGVTAAELERARRALISAHALALQRRSAVAAALARDEALGLPAGTSRRGAADLGRATASAVGQVARRILDPRREIVAVVKPNEAPSAVARTAAAARAAQGGGRPPAP